MPTLMSSPPLYRVRASNSAQTLENRDHSQPLKRDGFMGFSRPRPLSLTSPNASGQLMGDGKSAGGGGGGGSSRPNFATIATTAKAKDLLISAPIPIPGSAPRPHASVPINPHGGKLIGSRREVPLAAATVQRHSMVAGKVSESREIGFDVGMERSTGDGTGNTRGGAATGLGISGARRRNPQDISKDRGTVRRSWPEAGTSTAGRNNKSRMMRNMNLMDLEILVPPRRVAQIPAIAVGGGGAVAGATSASLGSSSGSESGSGRTLKRSSKKLLKTHGSVEAVDILNERRELRGSNTNNKSFQVVGRARDPASGRPMAAPTPPNVPDSRSSSRTPTTSSTITDVTATTTTTTTSSASSSSSGRTLRARRHDTIAGTNISRSSSSSSTITPLPHHHHNHQQNHPYIHQSTQNTHKRHHHNLDSSSSLSTLSTLAFETVYHPTATPSHGNPPPPFAPSPPPCSSTLSLRSPLSLTTLSDFPPPPSTISPIPSPPPPHPTVRFNSIPHVIPPRAETEVSIDTMHFRGGTRGRTTSMLIRGGRRLRSTLATIAKTCFLLPPLVAVLLADRVWRRVRGRKGPRKMRDVPGVWGVLGLVG
ncbi:hypothetical protein DFH27DRAFT_569189 [Peziza echinospora]|nr:hypothetical protein DFH27DRAFT_569189 [Peziza echinospora]